MVYVRSLVVFEAKQFTENDQSVIDILNWVDGHGKFVFDGQIKYMVLHDEEQNQLVLYLGDWLVKEDKNKYSKYSEELFNIRFKTYQGEE